MSSEYEQARFPLRRVALFGGGRWSRVLLPVIQSLLVEDAEILWVTTHGFEHAERWLLERAIERVSVRTQVDWDTSDCKLDAAIVATSPTTHERYVRHLLKLGIPTLCEKPFTLDYNEAFELDRMASQAGCPLGVNLEMYFASFIEDFATALHGRDIRSIEITWLDPWAEIRYGETKHGDIYTSIVDDMFPHCWSLLRRFYPGRDVDLVESVHYEPSSGIVNFTVRIKEAVVAVTMSRRSDRRVRKIEVNAGEAVLDFSTEPGSTKLDGVVTANEWRGLRPLSRSLSSFFEVVLSPELGSQWALSGCVDAVRSAQMIGSVLRALQHAILNNLHDTGVVLTNEAHRNLIVDLLLPEYAAKDRRWPATTMEDQIAFARHACTTLGIRYR